MTQVRLPRYLDKNLAEVKRISPIDASVSLKATPLSTASMSVRTEDAPEVGTWVEMYTVRGSAGIYRVSSVSKVFGDEISNVEMEHGITEVGDSIYNAEISKEMTLKAAIAEIWKKYKGNKWKIGTNAGTEKVTVDLAYDNVLTAILELLQQVPDYILTFNFATTPWTVNVVKKGTTVTAEGRLSRNVEEASVSYDDSETCTRVYVDYDAATDKDGKVSEHPGTLSVDSSRLKTYGIKEFHILGGGYTKAQAQKAAKVYLASHENPRFSATISGREFYHITKEPLDSVEIGQLYRLAVPEHKVTVEQHVTGITWPSVYRDPDRVEIELGAAEDPVVSFVRAQETVSRKSGKSAVKGNKEYWTVFERTDEYIELAANHADKNGKILEQAGLYIDKNGVLQYADDYKNSLFSKFKVNADAISGEVENRKNEGRVLKGQLDVAASKVDLLVTVKDKRQVKYYSNKAGFPDPGSTKYLYYDSSTKLYWEWKDGKYVSIGQSTTINAGGIISQINKDSTVTTHIKGDSIYIGDKKSTTVIGGKLDADKVTAAYLVGKMLNATGVTLNGITVNGSAAFNGSLLVANGSDVHGTTYASVKDAIYDLNIVQDGNKYTLQRKRFPDADWVDVGDFSRAVTGIGYKWSDSIAGRLTVTAYPQEYSKDPLLGLTLTGSWRGNTYSGKVKYYEGSDDEHTYDVQGLTYSVSRAISTLTASWTSGRCSVTAQPQNDTRQVCGIVTSGSWSGNIYNGKVQYYEGSDDDGVKRDTGLTFTVNATPIYNSVTVDEVKRSGSTVTATASNGKTGSTTLTSHTYCHQGLNYYDNSDAEIVSGKTKLYYKKDGYYFTAGTHYWFSADDSKTLYTYYD